MNTSPDRVDLRISDRSETKHVLDRRQKHRRKRFMKDATGDMTDADLLYWCENWFVLFSSASNMETGTKLFREVFYRWRRIVTIRDK